MQPVPVSQPDRLLEPHSRGDVYPTWVRMICCAPMIRRPTGKLGGRWVTYVPYNPSLEMPDEGMTNGRLTGIQSNRSSWRPPAALARLRGHREIQGPG